MSTVKMSKNSKNVLLELLYLANFYEEIDLSDDHYDHEPKTMNFWNPDAKDTYLSEF